MTVSGTGEERTGLWVVFLQIMLVSGSGGGARVLARGRTGCSRDPEVATAGDRLIGLNDSGEIKISESGSVCTLASFVDDLFPLGSLSSHDT